MVTMPVVITKPQSLFFPGREVRGQVKSVSTPRGGERIHGSSRKKSVPQGHARWELQAARSYARHIMSQSDLHIQLWQCFHQPCLRRRSSSSPFGEVRQNGGRGGRGGSAFFCWFVALSLTTMPATHCLPPQARPATPLMPCCHACLLEIEG